MNFKVEIDFLLTEKMAADINVLQIKEDEDNNIKILKVPVCTKGFTGFHFYLLDQKELLGEGAFGQVYKVFPINPTTGVPDLTKPWAVKYFRKISDFSVMEADIFQRYYKAEAPIISNKGAYFITEYFPGKEVFNNNSELNDEFKNLSLGQTFEIFYQTSLALNIMHHETKATGSALTHCDLKGQNMKINIIPKEGKKNERINVYLFDFGLTKEVDDNPKISTPTQWLSGSPFNIPPELYFLKSRGLNSDIYALVPIIVALSGGDPFLEKKIAQREKDVVKLYRLKYNLEGMFTRFEKDLESIPLPIKKLIRDFLERMQNAYSKRPDSDQTLKFFTALNNYYKLHCTLLKKEETILGSDETLLSYAATLMLCAEGLWQSKLQSYITNNPTFNATLCELYNKGDTGSFCKLTHDAVEGIIKPETISEKGKEKTTGFLDIFSFKLWKTADKETTESKKMPDSESESNRLKK